MEQAEKLASLVAENIKKFSGRDVVLAIYLQIGAVSIKVVVWRPGNYTLVAHNHEVPTEESVEVFNITSYHDSCWKYDGFSFLSKFSREDLKALKITSTELLKSQQCFMDDSERFFMILKN